MSQGEIMADPIEEPVDFNINSTIAGNVPEIFTEDDNEKLESNKDEEDKKEQLIESSNETPEIVVEYTGKLNTSETFKELCGLIRKSRCMKIILFVLVVTILLMLPFFISTTIISMDDDDCSKKLKSQESKVTKYKKKLDKLEDKYEELKEENEKIERELKAVKSKNKELQEDIEDRDKKIKKKDQEIATLTKDKEELEEKVSGMKIEINKLKSKIEEKEKEINHWKSEAETYKKKVDEVQGSITYYRWGLIGSGAINLIAFIDDFSVRSRLSSLETKYNELEKHNNEYKTRLGKLDELLPKLALTQANLKLLMQKTNATINSTLLFNSSISKFNKSDFLKKVSDNKPTAIIISSKDGYVFGGAINIQWINEGGPRYDHDAFTFSTNNAHVCNVKDNPAVNFDNKYFMEFGNWEININETSTNETIGKAIAGKFYDCGPYNENSFYAHGENITVNKLLAYYIDIKFHNNS